MPCTWANQRHRQHHAVSPLSLHVLFYHHTEVHPYGCLPRAPHTRIQPTPTFCCIMDVLKDRILAGRRPNMQLPSANLKAKAKALLWGKSRPQEHGHLSHTFPALWPNPESTSRPLPQHSTTPIQIRYSWKQYYSSKATAIIFAMTAEKEKHHCPKAMFCCSKNDEKPQRRQSLTVLAMLQILFINLTY